MALGAVVLVDIVLRLRDLQAFYGDQGLFGRALFLEQSWEPSVYHLFLASGSRGGLLVLFGLWAAAAACFTVGYGTRLAALVTWYFVASIQLRNPMVLDGGDDLLRVLLFWTPFLPLSARWSVDAARNPHWASLPNGYGSLATVGLTVQFLLFYLFAALLKDGEDWLKTGDALFYTLSIDQFSTTLGRALLAHPDLLRFLTWAALGLEYGLAFLLLLGVRYRPPRMAFYLLATAFHLAIAALLHFGIFMLVAVAALTAFLPSAWLDRWQTARATPAPMEADLPMHVEPDTPVQGVATLPPAYRLEKPLRLLALFMMAMIVVFNLSSLTLAHRIPTWTKPVVELTFEQQHWHFFAPNPFKNDGWYVFEVTEQDGTVHDVWGQRQRQENAKPQDIASRFFNQRWRRWLQNLVQIDIPDNQGWRQSTLQYLSRAWQTSHPDQKVQRFRLVLMQEINGPPGSPKPAIQRIVLAEAAPSMVPPAPQQE